VGLGSVRAVFTPSSPRHGAVDACPGALRLHAAADGPLARIRLPGGLLSGAQLSVLRALADRWGDGHVELTSRANVQLRALTGASPGALAAELWTAGLLPSQSHELVRNIAASPVPSSATRTLIADLDRRLCGDPQLAGLPGRFLFGLDDGHGDVAPSADVAAMPDGPAVAVLFAGDDAGLRVPPADTVVALLAAAHAFLAVRAESGAWRVRELPGGPAGLARRTASALGTRLGSGRLPVRARPRHLVGPLDRAAGALAPLGRLGPGPLGVLEKADQLVVTAQRGVIVADLSPPDVQSWLAALAGAGLVVEPGSPWIGVTTCAGRPGCAKALADVRADASAAVEAALPADVGVAVHWVGCARGCGSPAGSHVRVEATGDGYVVSAPGFEARGPASDVAGLVAAARRN
jgi:precorrin-3B synthase